MGKKTTIALIYDFDGTLAPGNMQEYGYMKAIGADKEAFWEKNNTLTLTNDASNILCYMMLMLKEADAKGIMLSREKFREFGTGIKLFEGVEGWFDMVNSYAEERGLIIKHFINSSGLKEIIEGTPIARHFEDIYASSYLYDDNDRPYWPAVAIDYTTKTQFIYKINKGIRSVCDSHKVNARMPKELRPMPYSQMIYIGDGTTDIPSMKVVKDKGGHAIAVYPPGDKHGKEMAERLIREDRVQFAAPANYRDGKTLFALVRRIIDKVKADVEFDRLIRVNNRRYKSG